MDRSGANSLNSKPNSTVTMTMNVSSSLHVLPTSINQDENNPNKAVHRVNPHHADHDANESEIQSESIIELLANRKL